MYDLLLLYRSVFQSSNLIGWDRVNLGCCYGNGTYVYIAVYNYWPIGLLEFWKGTLGWDGSPAVLLQVHVYVKAWLNLVVCQWVLVYTQAYGFTVNHAYLSHDAVQLLTICLLQVHSREVREPLRVWNFAWRLSTVSLDFCFGKLET